MSDLDAAVSMAAAVIVRAGEPPVLPPVAVGVVDQVAPSGAGFIVWVSGVLPSVIVCQPQDLSGGFIAEVQAANISGMVGRRVVVLFASNQALIISTLGV